MTIRVVILLFQPPVCVMKGIMSIGKYALKERYLYNITTLYNDIIMHNITTFYVDTMKGAHNCLKYIIKKFVHKYRNILHILSSTLPQIYE